MANIELPKDAEGREIPLDTTVLYDEDGKEIEVSRYQYYPKVGPGYWNLKSVRNKYYRMDEVHLTPPDSWKKLEEDLDRAVENDNSDEHDFNSMACAYMNISGDMCSDCKFRNEYVRDCTNQMLEDVVSRIRKLRGEGK